MLVDVLFVFFGDVVGLIAYGTVAVGWRFACSTGFDVAEGHAGTYECCAA